jgi:hypothetical protein
MINMESIVIFLGTKGDEDRKGAFLLWKINMAGLLLESCFVYGGIYNEIDRSA